MTYVFYYTFFFSFICRHDSVGIGLAIQVKILVAIPEQIWVAVEREDYLLGTQLFLLARHVKTGQYSTAKTFKFTLLEVPN